MDNFSTATGILDDLHGKLDKSKRTGDKLTARCPAHADKTPSLSVTIGDTGDCVVVHCFAGCATEDVVAALGWTMRDLFVSDANRPPVSSSQRVHVLDPAKLPGAPDPLPKGWGAADWDYPEGVDALEALRGAARPYEARAIGDDADAAKLEASPLPRDTPGNVRLWIDALTDADLDAQLRLLYLIAEAPEWAALVPALRIAVVGAIKNRTATSMAAAILGRFDDRKLAWREPPTEAVDTSEPDVVSLATLLADPPDPSATVARGLAFGGTMGFIRGPKASGKTTILAAAAARVSRGEPWAGHPTEAGTVLVVCNDDPRSWTLALRDFGADPERILTARARVVSKPGKLAALLAEHRPTWVIVDNLRTWCRAMHLDTDNSSAAADAIDPIAEAIRECGYPVACSIVHNESRSKSEGVIVKGVTANPYSNRLRNSTVFEDAADWIVGCAHVDGSTTTTITCGEKTRREIPTETLIIDLDADGHGTPSTGGGDDPFTISAPVNQLDGKITGYLMAHEGGATQNAVLKAVNGARRATLLDRLKVVGTLGPDKLWRCATGPQPPAKQSHNLVPPGDEITPPEQVSPESQPVGGENRGSGGVVPVSPTNGNRGGTSMGTSPGTGTQPIRVPVRVPVPGTSTGPHLAVPELLALASAKNTPPPPLQGGQAKGDDVAKHEKNCPGGCLGTGEDLMGDPCNYVRPIEPVVHTEGIKKWADESKTWVDAMLDDCGNVGNNGIGNVHLTGSDGWTVRDGDPRVHHPSLLGNETDGAEQEGVVH